MYIEIPFIESALIMAVILFVLIAVIAGIGWGGYIKTLAEKEDLIKELNNSKFWLEQYRKREIIRVANEYNKEGE